MIDERKKLLAGQRLVAGFEGYTVPESFQKLIRDCKIGNVILFRRNIQSAEQLRELCVFLHCLIRMETGLPPMILLDEEGGTVSRLGELGSVSPSAMAQGATGDPENAFRVGRMLGQELRAVWAFWTQVNARPRSAPRPRWYRASLPAATKRCAVRWRDAKTAASRAWKPLRKRPSPKKMWS